MTETKTLAGTTYLETYTTTSTVVSVIGQTVEITKTGPAVTQSIPTGVTTTTYTTLCPVTETKIAEGSTYYETYTTTSTIVSVLGATVEVTSTKPPVTQSTNALEYTTITSLCPITETKTVGGNTITEVWTSTSTIVTVAQTKIEAT